MAYLSHIYNYSSWDYAAMWICMWLNVITILTETMRYWLTPGEYQKCLEAERKDSLMCLNTVSVLEGASSPVDRLCVFFDNSEIWLIRNVASITDRRHVCGFYCVHRLFPGQQNGGGVWGVVAYVHKGSGRQAAALDLLAASSRPSVSSLLSLFCTGFKNVTGYSWTASSNENDASWKASGPWTQPSCLYM